MEVAAVEERDVRVRVAQGPRRGQAAEAAADDHDAEPHGAHENMILGARAAG